MEPIKPEKKAEILRNRPNATPEDIHEYEQLLAQRFTVNPFIQRSPEESAAQQKREARLRELHAKLFE